LPLTLVPAIAAAVGTSALLGVALYMKYGRSSGGGDKKNNSNGEVKSGGTVKSLKDKGNAMFKEGKYAQALELYSKAVEAATEENDPSLEQLFQNRAAVFEKLVRMQPTANYRGIGKLISAKVPKSCTVRKVCQKSRAKIGASSLKFAYVLCKNWLTFCAKFPTSSVQNFAPVR
jgi:tetratricopeptide (TPR) repeat protein